MRQHDAFRQAPGAGGIDDAGGVIRLGPGGRLDNVFVTALALFDNIVQMQKPEIEVLGRLGRVHGEDEFQVR